MTKKEKKEKRGWFLFMVGYFGVGYIFGYLLVYLSVVTAYLVIDDMENWMRTVRSFLIATTIAYILFLALPVRMEMRPELAANGGISEWATRLYYAVDLPYNCFPSLHVTYPVLATLIVWRTKPVMRWAFLAMSVVVSVSVVLVKQHYIADVVAGAANAAAGLYLAILYERYVLPMRAKTFALKS